MTVAVQSRWSAAADAAKLLIWLGLVILLVALPVAGVVSRGAIYALLPVGGVSILCGALLGSPTQGLRQLRDALLTPLGAAALLLAVWAALSLVWTPFPAEAGEKLFKMVAPAALAALVAAALPDKTRSFDLYVLPFGVAAAALAALVLALLAPPMLWNAAWLDETLLERTVITLIVLVWPALGALALREHWILAAALALLVACVALVDLARIALAAMGAGAFTFAVAMSAPGRTARMLAIASAGAILLAPLLPLGLAIAFGAFGEVPAPIAIWRETILGEWPRLVTGHGLGLADVARRLGYVPAEAPESLLFLLWYDLGAIGAVAMAVLVALAFMAAGTIASLLGPAMLAGLVSVLVIAYLGTAVGQIWWLTLLDCAAIAFVLVAKSTARTHRPDAIEIGGTSSEPVPEMEKGSA